MQAEFITRVRSRRTVSDRVLDLPRSSSRRKWYGTVSHTLEDNDEGIRREWTSSFSVLKATIERCFVHIIAVNQLSWYGAVAKSTRVSNVAQEVWTMKRAADAS